jgi:hypothetical protein
MGFFDFLTGTASVEQTIKSSVESLNSTVTNIMTNNSSSISSNQSSNQYAEIIVKGDTIDCDINIKQKAKLDLKTITKSSIEQTAKIETAIDAAVDQNAQQTAEAVSQFLGGSASVNNKVEMASIMKQIISNSVNVSNINQTANSQIITQNGKIYIYKTVKCAKDRDGKPGSIKIEQDAMIEQAVESITNTVANSIINNSEISRIIQSIKQKGKAKNEGLMSLAIAASILVACVIALKFAKIPWTPIIIFIVVSVGAIILLKKYKIWPFSRNYWGCAMSNKMNTGKCMEYDNEDAGPFTSKADCEFRESGGPSQNCPSYWGCDLAPMQAGNETINDIFTGKCKQYENVTDKKGKPFPLTGPYTSESACNSADACTVEWGCDQAGRKTGQPTGELLAGCIPYNYNAKNKPIFTFGTSEDCTKSGEGVCGGNWYRPYKDQCGCTTAYFLPSQIDGMKKDGFKFYSSKKECDSVAKDCVTSPDTKCVGESCIGNWFYTEGECKNSTKSQDEINRDTTTAYYPTKANCMFKESTKTSVSSSVSTSSTSSSSSSSSLPPPPTTLTPMTSTPTCSGECTLPLISSPTKLYTLVIEPSGVLAVHKADNRNTTIWSPTSTTLQGVSPYRLSMQTNGNLVLFDKNNKTLWESNTPNKGSAPYVLTMQDSDGNLVIYGNGTATWSSKFNVK